MKHMVSYGLLTKEFLKTVGIEEETGNHLWVRINSSEELTPEDNEMFSLYTERNFC